MWKPDVNHFRNQEGLISSVSLQPKSQNVWVGVLQRIRPHTDVKFSASFSSISVWWCCSYRYRYRRAFKVVDQIMLVFQFFITLNLPPLSPHTFTPHHPARGHSHTVVSVSVVFSLLSEVIDFGEIPRALLGHRILAPRQRGCSTPTAASVSP